MDGQSFEQIEAEGVERWLEELGEEIRNKTYRPQAVQRVWIPKPDRKERPLGIPTIWDWVVQMAAVIVLEPIYEADLAGEQYGYRPGRSAHDAVREIHGLLNRGYREVVDCDLSGYFDSIPHHELMKSVARRISDGAVLALIKAWLEMPVEEDDGRGGKRRTSLAKDSGRGTPQGAPISPLLSNLHEALRTGLETGWPSRASQSARGGLCGRLRDPVSWQRGAGKGVDGEDHEGAQADGEREENAHRPRSGGVLRLSRPHDWAVLLADGTVLHWHAGAFSTSATAFSL